MPRRGENIYKRKDGRWEGRYIAGRREDGRAVYRSLYAVSYQEVRARLSGAKAAQLRARGAGRLTVKALSQEWLERVRSTTKASSYARYALLVRRHLIPSLGNVRADRLTANLLSGFVNEKLRSGRVDGRGGLSPKTVQDIVIVLKAVLKGAGLEYGLPAATALKLPKAERPEVRVLTEAEAARLEKGLLEGGRGGDLGILLSLYTGLRLGEVCALRWSDVDWGEGLLRVRGTASRLPCGDGTARTRLVITSPKTRRAARVIPLPRALADTLRKYAVGQEKEAYILTGSAVRFMDPRTYQYRFRRAQERLRIAPVNFHALRHTFATQCIRRGMDARTLSEILGHATVQMTLDRYVHPSLELKKRQMAELDFSAR